MYQAYAAFALFLVFFEFWYGWLLGFHYDERRINKIRHVTHLFQTRFVRQRVTHTIHTTTSTHAQISPQIK